MNEATRQAFLEEYKVIEGDKDKMYMLNNVPHIAIGHNIVSRQLTEETMDFLGIEDESDLMTATLNQEQREYLFFKDLDIAVNDARDVINDCGGGVTLDIFDRLSEDRQAVLIDMSFNLGRPRFKKFKKMIKGVQDSDFDEAAVQILDSDAARDPKTAKRYEGLSERMRGEVEPDTLLKESGFSQEPNDNIKIHKLIADMREILNEIESTIDGK